LNGEKVEHHCALFISTGGGHGEGEGGFEILIFMEKLELRINVQTDYLWTFQMERVNYAIIKKHLGKSSNYGFGGESYFVIFLFLPLNQF